MSSCQTFDGMSVKDAARLMAGTEDESGHRTCRKYGSWAYRNATLAYSIDPEGDTCAYYCADCAEERIRALAESCPDYVVNSYVFEDVSCDHCGEDLGN